MAADIFSEGFHEEQESKKPSMGIMWVQQDS